jgi:predicted transposase YbfD/YdcC
VKENQPALLRDLEDAFTALEGHLARNGGAPPAWLEREWERDGVTFSRHREVSPGHGRTEGREAWALSDPEMNRYAGSAGAVGEAWPSLRQIVRLKRERTMKGKTTTETAYLVTSCAPRGADARRLLSYNRQYWQVENRLHWVRDETLGEDRSQIRSGAAPQVMAALRNLTLTLLRRRGHANIAAALRTYAGRPGAAVALVLNAHLAPSSMK